MASPQRGGSYRVRGRDHAFRPRGSGAGTDLCRAPPASGGPAASGGRQPTLDAGLSREIDLGVEIAEAVRELVAQALGERRDALVGKLPEPRKRPALDHLDHLGGSDPLHELEPLGLAHPSPTTLGEKALALSFANPSVLETPGLEDAKEIGGRDPRPAVEQRGPRTERAGDLPQRAAPVRDQVEDVNGHRGVERGVAVGKPGRVGAHRANAFAASLAFEPGEHRPREIDAEDGPDAPRERERDSAGADPDLEHTGIGPEAAGASEEVGHLRVDARRKAAGLVVLARDPVEGERSERLVGERSRLRLRHWLEDRRCRARRPALPPPARPHAAGRDLLEERSAPVGAALGLEVAEHRAQAPGLFTGGTDARYYAKLTPNVFRFTPVRGTLEDLSGIHGANERIAIRVYASAVRFYVRLVENVAGQAERVAATLAR